MESIAFSHWVIASALHHGIDRWWLCVNLIWSQMQTISFNAYGQSAFWKWNLLSQTALPLCNTGPPAGTTCSIPFTDQVMFLKLFYSIGIYYLIHFIPNSIVAVCWWLYSAHIEWRQRIHCGQHTSHPLSPRGNLESPVDLNAQFLTVAMKVFHLDQ